MNASIQTAMQKCLGSLGADHLEVVNESYMHNVAKGAESHFKVVVVSKQFVGKMLLARHRMVNELLKQQLDGAVHALSIHAMTPDEWVDRGGQCADSPQCLGGKSAL